MAEATLVKSVLLYLLIPSALVSMALCFLMRQVSPRIGYVDRPLGRKAHGRVVPYGGGIAIFLTFAVMVVAGALAVGFGWIERIGHFRWLNIHEPGVWMRINPMAGILFGACILLALGLFDDVKNLGPFVKLGVQFAVACLVVMGFGVHMTLFIREISVGWILSILWIVVITNAFNFLDNADGLSSGVALICVLVMLGVSLVGGQILVSAFLACFAGALLGFLLHNFPPAKIFLGDAGSLVVGFLLAVGSLLTTYYNEQSHDTRRTAVLIPLVVMAIPLYDFLSVIWLRIRSGVSPFVGDHRHFSHRLLKRGLSPRQMVLTVYLATAGTAVGAIMLRHVSGLLALLVFAQTLCIVTIIGILEYQPKNARDL